MENQIARPAPIANSRRRRRSGFSLIELMVVIVIIAILGGGAIFMFRDSADQAKISRASSEISQMRNVIAQYHLRFGNYPSDLNEAQTTMKQKFPELDPWNRPYEYTPEEEKFTLWSKGVKAEVEEDDVWYDSETGRVVTPDARNQK